MTADQDRCWWGLETAVVARAHMGRYPPSCAPTATLPGARPSTLARGINLVRASAAGSKKAWQYVRRSGARPTPIRRL